MTATVLQNQPGGLQVPVGVGHVIVQETNTPVPTTRSYENYQTKVSIITGVLRLLLVIVAVILEIIAINQGSILGIFGYQTLWTGIALSASGCLGIAAGAKPSSALIVSHSVLSIVCCSIFALVQISLGAVGWAVDWGSTTSLTYVYTEPAPGAQPANLGLSAAITFIGMAQVGLNIWASILGCTGCCSSPDRSTTTTTTTYTVPAPGGQPNPQQPGYPPHPPVPQMGVEWSNNTQYGESEGGYLTPATDSQDQSAYMTLVDNQGSIEDHTYDEVRTSKMDN